MRGFAREIAERRLPTGALEEEPLARRWDQAALRCVLAAGLARLCRRTHGAKSTTIAYIDGAADCSHASLCGSSVEVIDHAHGSNLSRAHATFIASIFAGSGPECLGLCPECSVLNISVVDDAMLGGFESPRKSAVRLAGAIDLATALDARILQISLDLSFLPHEIGPVITAIDAAVRHGTVVVIAAGQSPLAQPNPLITTPGVIAVSGVDRRGCPLHSVHRSVALNVWGISAPATEVPGAVLPSGTSLRTGTSFAACFVTAAIALMCSTEPWTTPRDAARCLLARHFASRGNGLPIPLDADGSIERPIHP